MTNKLEIKKLSLYSLFLFPILPNAPQSILLGVFLSLSIFGNFDKVSFNVEKLKEFTILSFYYIWYIVSILWSTNSYTGVEIQTNIALLFLPFIISFFNFKVSYLDVKICLKIFIVSLLGYLLLYFQYLKNGIILFQERIPDATNKILYLPLLKDLSSLNVLYVLLKDFFDKGVGLYLIAKEAYNYFGEPEFFTHYNYVLPCFLMGFLACLYLIKNTTNKYTKLIYFLIAIVFSFFIIYSNALMSKVILLMILLGGAIYIMRNKTFQYRIVGTLILSMLLIALISKINFSKNLEKIEWVEKSYDPAERKMAVIDYVRYSLYTSSMDIIRNNFIFGVGIGDVPYELNSRLPNVFINGIGTLGLKSLLNCHSQYIHFWLCGGIVGFLGFVIMLLYLIYISIRNKGPLCFLWIVIFGTSCLFENFLSRYWGVLFFGSFYILFLGNYNFQENE